MDCRHLYRWRIKATGKKPAQESYCRVNGGNYHLPADQYGLPVYFARRSNGWILFGGCRHCARIYGMGGWWLYRHNGDCFHLCSYEYECPFQLQGYLCHGRKQDDVPTGSFCSSEVQHTTCSHLVPLCLDLPARFERIL